MKFDNRNLYTKASMLMLLGYFVTFLFFYFANALFYDVAAFSYLWIFVQKATFLLFPVLTALLALIGCAYRGMKFALVRLIPLSLAKMIYSLPYYYLYFVYDIYDSAEALLFSLVQSLIESIILYLFSLIIFLIMRFAAKKLNKTNTTLADEISKKTVLDFANPISLTFMITSLLCFLYFFTVEIIDTVAVIGEYSGNLSAGDIIFMVISYLFDAALFVFYYFAMSLIKNKITEYRLSKVTDTE